MILENAFDVNAPVQRVWPTLKDVPRVAGCIPNAEITEVIDEQTYRATVAVKVGPVSVSYRATIVIEGFDDAQHVATMRIKGDETRGRGGVTATVRSQATANGGTTHVTLHTDARISGIVATLGGRLIEGVAQKTVATFAANLAKLV